MSSQPNLPTPLDLDAIRARLAESKGPQFWRSLDEAAGAPEFQEYLDNEFTPGTSEWTDGVSRRRLLELLGGTLGLAGLTSCTKQPPEKIVPYVTAPEDIIAGKPLFYATSLIGPGGVASGVLVESHMGRPTKIEGNPEHPGSLGATDAQTQAAILQLWDPDRTQTVFREGRNSSWQRAQQALQVLREQMLSTKGEGFRLLTETVTSPTLAAAINEFLAAFPSAKWIQYEPAGPDNVRAGTRLAFGQPLAPVYHIDQAEVIVALDSDFLFSGPGAVRYAREFANRRRAADEKMSRLYVVEPTPSITGASAEHRLVASAAEVESFARALAAELGAGTPAATAKAAEFYKAVVKDLNEHKGTSLVIAGEFASPAVQALAHAINAALGNVGKTVHYIDAPEAAPADQTAALKELVGEMQAGKVEALLVAGGNPNYNTPADLKFEEAFRKVKLRIRLCEYDDETAAVCHWVIPMAHALESWGDARAYDGSVSLQQPLIAPLYEGKQLIELIGVLIDKGGREVRDVVKEYWRGQMTATPNFDDFWQKSIHDGVVAGSAPAAKTVAVRKELAAELGAAKPGGPELLFRPCPNIGDGRFSNNAWLQELPRPLSKLTWDNAVLMSPATAQKHGASNGQLVKLANSVTGPAWIMPGQADDSIVVHLGYGRTRIGKIANDVGFNAYKLRNSAAPWNAPGVPISNTGDSQIMAVTQEHSSMEGRGMIRMATIEEFKKEPEFATAEEKGHELFSLYPGYEYKSYSWGMSIDLTSCIGCNACTIACQAENNIPVVGKDQVNRGREMHWIRVDRYFEGHLDTPSIHHQPVTCMHCDNAPCEPVCPVAATTHSEEGLNQMTYNRCVGTRYCSNNCPYKVRRFNFYLYSDWDTQSLKGLRNPNVTVRSRGVMEKCSYCVQRINAARIEAEKENRRIRDGEVITACQAACPSGAIVFGDMNDPNSKIAKVKKSERNYGLLTELGTHPRTTYLAKVTNPNHDLAPKGSALPAHGEAKKG
jgi:molybdopterin-containing oxidoreductase family iron-sulfur binding subunit